MTTLALVLAIDGSSGETGPGVGGSETALHVVAAVVLVLIVAWVVVGYRRQRYWRRAGKRRSDE
jgi:hypothetical protein